MNKKIVKLKTEIPLIFLWILIFLLFYHNKLISKNWINIKRILNIIKIKNVLFILIFFFTNFYLKKIIKKLVILFHKYFAKME